MPEWFFALLTVVLVTLTGMFIFFRRRDRAYIARRSQALDEVVQTSPMPPVSFARLSNLPEPVQRYFRHVLSDGQSVIQEACLTQVGVLRTGVRTNNWMRFTATQRTVPGGSSFLWNARIDLPLGNHIRVLDSFVNCRGAGRVSLWSAFVLGQETGGVGLDTGCLYRYLAEGVWCPTALLPDNGVQWTEIDDHRAQATLTLGESTATMEFRFNERHEVAAVYTPDRPGNLDGRFRNAPWEGHFSDYRMHRDVCVPAYGEVGWYDGDQLELVWEGRITDSVYRFAEIAEKDSVSR